MVSDLHTYPKFPRGSRVASEISPSSNSRRPCIVPQQNCGPCERDYIAKFRQSEMTSKGLVSTTYKRDFASSWADTENPLTRALSF